jgi:hypothetical protein
LEGLTVVFGGLPLTYFPAGVPVPASADIANFDETEDRALMAHPRMRRVLMKLLPTLPTLYYYLHFSDGSDLRLLDDKVAAGVATDDDVRNALLGEAQSVICPHCAAVIRAIVMDPGHPLFAADRGRRLREHKFHRECPVCGGYLSLYILELIDPITATG